MKTILSREESTRRLESRRVAEERIARGIMGAGHSGPVAGRASIATGTVQGTTAAPRRRAAALAPREAGSGGVSESGRFCQGAAGSREAPQRASVAYALFSSWPAD